MSTPTRLVQLLLAVSLTSWNLFACASEKLFLDNCAECHQRDGQGIANVYPSLVRSEVVRGSAVDVALVLLIGRGEMPSFKGSLSNADMASVINYVRSELTGGSRLLKADPISAEQIAALQ